MEAPDLAISEVVTGNQSWLPTLRPRDGRVAHRRVEVPWKLVCAAVLGLWPKVGMAGTGDQTEAQARCWAGVAGHTGNRGVSFQVPTTLEVTHSWHSDPASNGGRRCTRTRRGTCLPQAEELEQRDETGGGQSNLPTRRYSCFYLIPFRIAAFPPSDLATRFITWKCFTST